MDGLRYYGSYNLGGYLCMYGLVKAADRSEACEVDG